jgi:hypothetical protein
MVKCMIIEKNGDIKTTVVRDFDVRKLYKKCLLQNDKNFECRHIWELKKDEEFITIFAKNSGRAGSENKYDLPPPLDKSDILFFGKILLVKHTEMELNNQNVVNLELSDWEKFYESLFGGFESLGEEDEYSEEEIIPKELQTKHGYLKDGFVVDSDDESDLESLNDSDGQISDKDSEDNVTVDLVGNSEDENVDEVYDSDSTSDGEASFGSELSEESYLSD